MPYGKKSAGTFGFVTGFSAIMALMMAPADAVAQSLTATIGVDQSEGDYGTDTDTSISALAPQRAADTRLVEERIDVAEARRRRL